MNAHRWTWTCMAVLSLICLIGGAPNSAIAAEGQQAATGMIPPDQVVVPTGPSSYVTGSVVSSTPEMLVVREPDGQTMDFALDEHRGYGAAMIPGDRVRVEYGTLDNCETVAKNVETLDLLAVLGEEGGGNHAAAAPAVSRTEPTAANSPATSGAAGANEASMPATASPLPALLATGALFFAAGVGIRLLNRG